MLCLLLSLSLSVAPPLTLDRLLNEVSEGAPALRAQQESVAVAKAGQALAGAWEDPSVMVMAEDIPVPGPMASEGEAMSPMLTYRLSQPLNLFGRRGLAKEAAGAQVAAEQAGVRRAEWDARAQAVGGFYELWMNGQMATILDKQISALERMHEAARARYAAGLMMGHHEVLRAQSELASMRAERESLADERTAIVALLNTLRGQPADAPLGEPVLPEAKPLPDLAQVLARAEQRPEVASMRSMQAEMEARRGLARRMYLPMVMAEAFYQQRTGGPMDSFGGALTLSVPLWWFDRQRHEVEMTEAMVRRAQRGAESMRAMTEADLRMAYSRARAAERSLTALEGTALPKLRETVTSAQAAYASGSADFLALLESTMALRSLEMERVRAVVRRENARFELSRLLGGPLEKP